MMEKGFKEIMEKFDGIYGGVKDLESFVNEQRGKEVCKDGKIGVRKPVGVDGAEPTVLETKQNNGECFV